MSQPRSAQKKERSAAVSTTKRLRCRHLNKELKVHQPLTRFAPRPGQIRMPSVRASAYLTNRLVEGNGEGCGKLLERMLVSASLVMRRSASSKYSSALWRSPGVVLCNPNGMPQTCYYQHNATWRCTACRLGCNGALIAPDSTSAAHGDHKSWTGTASPPR